VGMGPRCLGGLGCLSNWLVGILSAEWESSRIHGASLTMRVSLSEREFALSSDRVRRSHGAGNAPGVWSSQFLMPIQSNLARPVRVGR
jgi:hypothetical protein